MDLKYMEIALELAKKAYEEQEVPVGCVIVLNDEIIGYGYNRREQQQSSLAHAEILAIKMANEKIGSWRLEDASIYVTLEPCIMCSGAIVQSRIKNVYFGASEPKGGGFGSVINIVEVKGLNHYPNVERGILAKESSELLKSFFKAKRQK